MSISSSGKNINQKQQQQQQQQQQKLFEPGVAIQQQQAVQHLLLPYAQRLLLPSGSFLTGQQHHQRLPGAAATAAGSTAATAATRRGPSRSVATRGLRSTGTAAVSGIAATAAASSSSAAGGSAAGGSAAAGVGKAAGEGSVPIDGMEGLVNGVSALRFSRDDRLAEVRCLLGTNMPVLLAVSPDGHRALGRGRGAGGRGPGLIIPPAAICLQLRHGGALSCLANLLKHPLVTKV